MHMGFSEVQHSNLTHDEMTKSYLAVDMLDCSEHHKGTPMWHFITGASG